MTSHEPSHRPQSWEHLLGEDPHSAGGFRLGVAAAIAIHAAIFAITWPTVAQAPPDEPEETYIYCELHPVIADKPPPPRELDLPTPVDEASIIVPGEPEEVSTEPLERELPTPPTDIDVIGCGLPTVLPPPPPPPDPPPTIVDVHVDIEPPEIVHRVDPRYTEPARHAGVEGVVILKLLIDPGGAVESIEVLRPLPLGLTQSAVEAVEQWRFSPSTFNGRPVSVRYVLTVRFTLT
jgi:protein TonB